MPYHQSVLHKVKPIYETLRGWNTDISQASRVEELPAAARDYVRFVEDFLRVPVTFIGVGPARDQTVVLPRVA